MKTKPKLPVIETGNLLEDEELLATAVKWNKRHPVKDEWLFEFYHLLIEIPLNWWTRCLDE